MDRAWLWGSVVLHACSTREPQRQAASSEPSAALPLGATGSALPSQTSAGVVASAAAMDAAQALVPLRAALEKVRESSANEAFEIKDLPPVAALVGEHRDAIERSLGKATECKVDARKQLPAPCSSTDDVYYELFKLAKGSRGGGPNLVITYDEDAFCTQASVRQTR